MRPFYDENARNYDDALINEINYVAPRLSAAILDQSVGEDFNKHKAGIIDFGCGTGMAAEELQKLGFKNIDGVDYSEGMLEVAREKKCYQNLWQVDLNNPLDFETDEYDAGLCVGAFAHDHITLDAVDEMVRVVKPGSILIITMNERAMANLNFPDKLAAMQSQMKIELLSSTEEDYHVNENIKGWINVLKKLED